MSTKAKDLKRGDLVWMQAYGEVVAVTPVGKWIEVVIDLVDTRSLDFSDAGSSVKLICKPGRPFQKAYRKKRGGDGDDEPDFTPPPDGNVKELV
jgi:hypothetical protein